MFCNITPTTRDKADPEDHQIHLVATALSLQLFFPYFSKDRQIDWYAVRGHTAPMHLGRKQQALCAPLLVSPVISRGAPRQAMVESSISERWNGRTNLALRSRPPRKS
jgi:hypothetical protein